MKFPNKSPRSLSLLSGGEKAMTAIAFLFSLFLARPCPFYILDEVEASLDDINIRRFLSLVRNTGTRRSSSSSPIRGRPWRSRTRSMG